MYKKYRVPGMDEPFDVEDINVEKFLAKFPDAELIEDEVSVEPIEPTPPPMEPLEPPTEPITASTDINAYGAADTPVTTEVTTINPITDKEGNITSANLTYQEENAAGDGSVTIEEEMPIQEAALTQAGINNYLEALSAAQGSVGITPSGLLGKVPAKIARVIRSSANIFNNAGEKLPKMIMTGVAEMFMDNEDLDDENEREALRQTVDNMYDTVASLPMAAISAQLQTAKIAGEVAKAVTPFANDLPEGVDFISLAQEGEYGAASDDFLNSVAEGIPSLMVAMYGGVLGWGTLGGGQAGAKFEEGFEDLEGKEEGGIPARLYGAAAASGLVEFTLNRLTPLLLGKGAQMISDAVSPKAAGEFFKRTMAGLGGGSLEFVEEGLADTSDRLIDRFMLGKYRGEASDWGRGFFKGGTIGFALAGPVSAYSYNFDKQSPSKKDLIANKIQPNKLNNSQLKKEKILFKAGMELNQLQNDPELYKAKVQEIKDIQNSLRESRNAINDQISELSPDQFDRLNNISNEINSLREYLNPNFNSELEVDTAKNKIKELEQEQENIFLNPQGIDKQRPEPILPENIKLSEATQNIYGVDPDANAEKVKVTSQQIDKIIDNQLGLINNVAIKTVGGFGKEGDIAEMVSQLKYAKGGMVDLIKQYNPALGVPLSAYLANPRTGLPQRAKRIVKNVTKQDVSLDEQFSQPETLTQQAFDTDFDVKMGAKLLADRIGLPTTTINEVNDLVDRSLVNVESKLKQKDLTPKQKIAIADKAFAKPFIDRISKDIKNTLGKGEKFDKFVDKNWKPIAEAVIATNKVTKSQGPTQRWSQLFPNKEQVINYFTGKDLIVGDISSKTGKALTKGQKARAVSDRKNVALAKALATQIGIEARNEVFEKNPRLREQFQKDTKIQWSADADLAVSNIKSSLSKGKSSKPQVIFLTGPAGSGKSTIAKKFGKDYIVLDKDVELQKLIKEAGLPADTNKYTTKQRDQWRALQSKASDNIFSQIEDLKSQGKNIVIDDTGSSKPAILRLKRELEQAGYDSKMLLIDGALDKSLERNKARKEKVLTDTMVKNSFEAIQKNKKGYREAFKNNYTEATNPDIASVVEREYFGARPFLDKLFTLGEGIGEKFKEQGKQILSAFKGGKKLWTTKKVTQSDLNNNPAWVEAGVEVGHNIYNGPDIETLKEQLGSTISKLPKNLSELLGVNNVYALVGKKNRAFDPAKITKPSFLEATQEDLIAEYKRKYDSALFSEETVDSIRKSLGGSPKWLINADGTVERIKPGDPGVGYEFFKDKEASAKDVQELYKKGEISKESYNEYKKIKLNNVQLQNTQFKKKGTLLGDAIDIAKSDKYKTKEERQAAFDKLWPPNKVKAIGDANHQIMKFYVSLLKNEYKNGNISEDALTTLLQWQSSIVEGFRSLTGFDSIYFADGPTVINKGEHLKPNALSMAQLKNNITGAPTAKTLDEIIKGHMQAFGPSKLFDEVDVLGKTTAMPGLERIVFGIGPNKSNNFYNPTAKKTLLQMRLEDMAKQEGIGIDEAYAKLWNKYQIDGSVARTIESVIDVSKMKMYKKALDENAPQLNKEDIAKGFIDILQGNWNKDGKTRLEAFTDPDAMADILMNEYGQNEIQAKEGVKHFGFKIGNKIYINLAAGKGIETAIHESGHLWNSIVHQGAPKIWNGIMSRVKEAGMWDTYVKQIEKSPNAYGDILESYSDGSNTFDLENEVFARILEEYGGKKIAGPKTNLQKIKDIIGKYFNELKTMLGFDPTTKNFGDLTVKEMIDLAVSEVVTGNPLANFSQLKDSQNQPWFIKTHQEVSPTFKADSNPEFQALKQLQKEYRNTNYDLVKAIENSYKQVKDIMPFEDWAQFVQNTIIETDVKVGETVSGKALLVAKKDAIENEKTRINQLKVLRDNGLFTEGDQFLPTQLLNEKLRKADDNVIEQQKQKSEGLNKNLRKILNNKSGIGKKPSKWFVPANAEDFKGLLYALLPGGKEGAEAKKFFKSTLIDPYHKGVAASEAEILQKIEKYSKISKGIDLTKKIEGTPYNIGDAVKIRNWVEDGIDVDIKKQEYIDSLVDTINNDIDLQSFANIIQKDFPIEYNAEWRNDSFNKSIYQNINAGSRARHLEVFANNVDNIFDKDNLREIENLYGKNFRQALQNSLKRMRTGKNRVSTDSQSNKFLTWVNRAVATTMFINTRSAALQLLSSLNYIGKPNNNIFKATTALGPGWRADFNKLWNSPYLKNRREGAKFDVLADEIAEKGEKGLNKLLKFGFLPTRYADSFAIALGGTAYYKNTKNAFIKDGMDPKQAEEAAMKSWIEATEESQQSADPAMISEIQSSNVGKLIYAFANTPFQYIRKSKRHLQDIVSGRSAAEGGANQIRKDLQSVLYYTVGQAMMFNALQSALFAVAWEDDEEKKKALLSDKEALIIERALTSYMKSMGNPGAIIGSLYSMIAEGSEQIQKKGRIDNPYKIALEATSISPPLNAKLKDLVAIGNIYKYNYKEIKENPLKPSVDNPTFEIAGNAASFVGVPLDRVIRKAQNLSAIANEEAETWQKVFQVLGWNEWDFYSPTYQEQQRKAQKEKNKYMPSSLERIQKYNQMSSEEKKAYTQKRLQEGKPLFKKENGVKILGKAHKDGTIEIAPGLSPEKRKQVERHEEQHGKDMAEGRLDYNKDWIRWGNNQFKRTPDKKVVYKGKKYIEGHPILPWEAAANKAENRVS